MQTKVNYTIGHLSIYSALKQIGGLLVTFAARVIANGMIL